jgi:uncharacterized membrane protein YphA (DoxX/SURF4 family)
VGRLNREAIAGYAYALLGIVAGLTFFRTGAMKIFGWFGGIPGMPAGGVWSPDTLVRRWRA